MGPEILSLILSVILLLHGAPHNLPPQSREGIRLASLDLLVSCFLCPTITTLIQFQKTGGGGGGGGGWGLRLVGSISFHSLTSFFSHEASTPFPWALLLCFSFLGSPPQPPNSSTPAEQQLSKLIHSGIFHLPFARLFLDSHFFPSSVVIFATGESSALSHAWR